MKFAFIISIQKQTMRAGRPLTHLFPHPIHWKDKGFWLLSRLVLPARGKPLLLINGVIVAILGPAKPKHLLIQKTSLEGATVRVELCPHLLHLKGAIQWLGDRLQVHVLQHGVVHPQAVLGNCLAIHFITVISGTK